MDNIIYGLICLSAFAAWITHIIVAIAAKAWVFMILGVLFFPLAVVHGYATWLGYDWLN